VFKDRLLTAWGVCLSRQGVGGRNRRLVLVDDWFVILLFIVPKTERCVILTPPCHSERSEESPPHFRKKPYLPPIPAEAGIQKPFDNQFLLAR
jgi:hypothetical protein